MGKMHNGINKYALRLAISQVPYHSLHGSFVFSSVKYMKLALGSNRINANEMASLSVSLGSLNKHL